MKRTPPLPTVAGALRAACRAALAIILLAGPAAAELRLDFDASRRAFVRMEAPAETRVRVVNASPESVAGVVLRCAWQGSVRSDTLGDLAPGAAAVVRLGVDTGLRPDGYPLTVSARAVGPGGDLAADTVRTLVVTPRPQTRMPVVMWGGGDPETLADIGFTHKLVWLQDYRRIWDAGEPTEAVGDSQRVALGDMLDDLQARGLAGAVYLYPGRWVGRTEGLRQTYGRVDRDGELRDRENVCANFPRVRAYAFDVGASVARTFGAYPALQAALVHSEIRDATDLCFHAHDRRAYRDAAGVDIPAAAHSKEGVRYTGIAGFPADRVIADDDPLLTFYRWFWKEGDGWNGLHSQVVTGLKSTGRTDLWTFFDPAVRVPSVWGSGGDVDVLSQWTYSYPDPIKIGQAADELFAMAAGHPGQRVMKMTQIIWYRSQTAPDLPADESARADWERTEPEARFITIAPDHLREAFWSKISRPVRGIMYHGWGSLVGAEHTSYRLTNPRTRQVLTELVRDVIVPLGPTLLAVDQDRPTRVALLESFASQVFAGRGTRGWSGSWEADVHLVLQYAGLQPRILYDETVLRDGLDAYDVLVMPACDVLTESVATAVEAFQARGGLVVADENLAPRLLPDILLERRARSGRPDEDKAALQALARRLRSELAPYVEPYAESDAADIVLRLRRTGDADYLFALNDRRTFGDYVGHHGKVMERGLPDTARITVRRAAGAVYDLVAHRRVPLAGAGSRAVAVGDAGREARLAFDLELGPGGGTVLLLVPRPIGGVDVAAPSSARLGDRVTLDVRIADSDGAPVDAVVPVQLEVLDPEGRLAEASGAYAAVGGRLAVTLDLAANDVPGPWTLRATEGASAYSAAADLLVRP